MQKDTVNIFSSNHGIKNEDMVNKGNPFVHSDLSEHYICSMSAIRCDTKGIKHVYQKKLLLQNCQVF